MTANPTFNPYVTTNATGSFNASSTGYIQGMALDDPAVRNALSGGVLSNDETIPMWGGVAISEAIPTSGSPAATLGGIISRATALGTAGDAGSITGFSVFNQDYAMVNTPQSPVPLSGSGGQVNFYRLGTGARIPVACDPSLVDLEGNIITSQVSWDFVGQLLVPYAPVYAADVITGATWASTAGGETTFAVSSDLTSDLSAGSIIDVSGVVISDEGPGYNGRFTVVSLTSSHIVVKQPGAASPGTYSSGGSVAAGGGALPVKVLDLNIGNSMTVDFDTDTGFATWNRTGSCAVILI